MTIYGRTIKTYDLRSLSNAWLVRLDRRVWESIVRDDGYQPFGHDRVTLEMVHPGRMDIMRACYAESLRRGV